MGLEVGTYVNDLVTTNPVGASDSKSQGDDHLRLIKNTLKNTFPLATGARKFASTDAGAAAGPIWTLHRDSASPAANDLLGAYDFTGEDSTSVETIYARLQARIDDPTNASEDGSLLIQLMAAGALTTALTIAGSGITANAGTFSRAASGATATISGDNLIIEDNNNVGISLLSPNTALGVIQFGDPEDGDVGRIWYDHATNAFTFYTAGTLAATISSAGNFTGVGSGTFPGGLSSPSLATAGTLTLTSAAEDYVFASNVFRATSNNGVQIGASSIRWSNVFSVLGNFTGQVNVADLVASGNVSGVAGTFSGAVSGTTGTFSGAVSGTTGTFNGDVSANASFISAGASVVLSPGSAGTVFIRPNTEGSVVGQATFTTTLATINTALDVIGPIQASLGSMGAPSISFTSDTNTGFYRSDVDEIGIATGGAFRGNFTSSGINLGKALQNAATVGLSMATDGQCISTVSADTCFILNRTSTDGTIVQIRNDNTTVGTIAVSGATTDYNTTSDEDFKKNFKDFDGGEIIDNLNTYHFDWKNPGRGLKDGYGVKAQEAYKVFPHPIKVGNDKEPWGADYSKYVPILLNEVKALRSRVKKLETKKEK